MKSFLLALLGFSFYVILNIFQDGGCFRLFPSTSDVPIDIEPRADRLLLLWSDRRNPHEVRPVYRDR